MSCVRGAQIGENRNAAIMAALAAGGEVIFMPPCSFCTENR
jgi:hypothetical protein